VTAMAAQVAEAGVMEVGSAAVPVAALVQEEAAAAEEGMEARLAAVEAVAVAVVG